MNSVTFTVWNGLRIYTANQHLSIWAGTFCISVVSSCLCHHKHTETLTIPYTTIELHPKANAHNPISQRVEAHHAGHNRRAQVFQNDVIGVLITRHHLGKRSTNIQTQTTWSFSPCYLRGWINLAWRHRLYIWCVSSNLRPQISGLDFSLIHKGVTRNWVWAWSTIVPTFRAKIYIAVQHDK